MDLNDVIDRAELKEEVARRFGNPPAPGRRPKMDPHLAGAWSLLCTAMKTYDPANALGLVRAAAAAHRKYTAPGALMTAGFLHFIFEQLAPHKQSDSDLSLDPRLEWAARVVECVRAGLGDKNFSRLIEGISDILVDLADEAEPVSARQLRAPLPRGAAPDSGARLSLRAAVQSYDSALLPPVASQPIHKTSSHLAE
ncbi:hypothetical protein GCM10010372_83840 [Streptomyces tauricus]|uniref:hypothetical protein n=1 Tax=Streptomyces tauricus TaxID=68274 RepID=UPI001676B34F|nr:hypothetical protein [Streptomyces tauricus]GHA72187.1 hypothetical protein GCM10010372_83840 [Streptomyces tauricus]